MFNLSAFLSYVLVMTFTPGPNNITCMAKSSMYGYKKTLTFILGICTGYFFVLIISSYFNLILFNIIPKIKIFMGILGAVYMLYLAIKILKSRENTNDNNAMDSKINKNGINSFFTGIVLQFINPKGIIFALTISSSFILPYYNSNSSIFLFALLLICIGFISLSSWALFGSFFNKFIS